METPQLPETPSAGSRDPHEDLEAPSPPSGNGLVIVGESDAPTCTDGVCW